MQQALKIMIVDDDALALEVAAAVLENHGYAVIKRDSALGTMLAIRRDKPDVLLLDVHMPGLSGDALTKLIVQTKGSHEPIVILYSATAIVELEQLAQNCHAAGAIEKTPDQQAFLRRLDQLLARGQKGRSRFDAPPAVHRG